MERSRPSASSLDTMRAELIAMAEEDQRVRAELLAEGVLFDGYQPRMAEVHHRNAVRLAAIMEARGWPGRSVVGQAAADAAWLVLQHAIGDPAIMRRGLELLRSLPAGEVDPIQVAMLDDRVRTFSGLPQLYGTQFDWDEQGEMQPRPIEDAAHVDERRAAIGLPPVAEKLREIREALGRAGETMPVDATARRREIDAWERSVGWHD
jgi:uncharacterized protein DUF6624